MLHPKRTPDLGLMPWPSAKEVPPHRPLWPESEELALKLDEQELAAFDDRSLGSEDRAIALTAQAPTASGPAKLGKCFHKSYPRGCRAVMHGESIA